MSNESPFAQGIHEGKSARDNGAASAARRLRVLHVAESLGAGVATAVRDFVASTPQIEHTVLAALRPEDTGETIRGATLSSLPSGHVARIRAISRFVANENPDVIHAHSSYGGFYVRMASVPRERIVYSPHCYPFERQDAPVGRRVFWMVEKALARRTFAVAAVGQHEANVAERLNRKQVVEFVPNFASPGPVMVDPYDGMRPCIVTAGRLSEQKGPDFFAAAVRASKARGVTARWVWIGGGKDRFAKMLADEGVEVSGWIPRAQALALMATADLYVHAAGWEGFPITLLEAAALRRPIVCRRIPSLEFDDFTLADTPEAMADLIVETLRSGQDGSLAARLTEKYSQRAQADRLTSLYRRVAGITTEKPHAPVVNR